MKVCKKCQKEFDENLTYCPFCGAENADKKLTYFERKIARDKDTEIILNKASIQNEDIEQAKDGSASDLVIEKTQETKKAKIISLIRIGLSLVLAIACLVLAFVATKNDINPNLKLVVILLAFLAVAVCASVFISDIYSYLTLRKMSEEDFSIRKIYYTKSPMFVYGDSIYEIKTNLVCDKCNSKMHIEIKDEDLFLVCDVNRSHLVRIKKEDYISYFKDKLSDNDN